MAQRKHSRRQGVVAFAAIVFTAAGLALPIIMVSRSGDSGIPGSAVVAAIRNQYTLSGPVRLLNTPALTVETGSISVSPAQAARTGEAVAALLAAGTVRLVLDNAVIRLDAPDDEFTIWQNDNLGPILSSFLQLAFEGLDIRHSRVVMRMRNGADVVFSDVNAEITVQRKGVTGKGTFEYRGQRLTFDAMLGSPERKAGVHFPVKASVKGNLVDSQIDGTLVVGDGMQLTGAKAVLTTPDIRRAANWLGAGWPAGPGLGFFRAEGQVDWIDRTIAFQKAEFSIDDNQATGALTFGFDGPRPSIEGTLDLPRLDLSRYLSTDEGSATSREAMLGPLAPWLATPVSFSAPLLPLIDADLRISAAKTSAGHVKLGRSAATLSLKSGRLLADVAELEIESGSIGGGQLSVDMSASEPSFTLRGKLSGVETSRLAEGLLGHGMVSGRGDIVVDLTAQGETSGRLIGTMSGKASLSIPQGGRVGLDLKQMTELSEPQGSWPWLRGSSGETSVAKLDAKLLIDKGMVRTDAVSALVNDKLIAASGRVDLESGNLDLAISKGSAPVANAELATQIPSDLAKLVELHGPWRYPSVIPAGRTAVRAGTDAKDASQMPAPAGATREP